MTWSEDEILVLKVLYPHYRINRKQICRILKREWATIRQKANRLGLSRYVMKLPEFKRIVRPYLLALYQKRNMREVGKILGVSHGTVSRWLS